jgi:type II secretory pathway component GspD/PulD (secretin)
LSLSEADAIVDAAREMIRENYSVRQAESLVAQPAKKSGSKKTQRAGDPNVRAALTALERALGTKVAIRQASGRGKIEIHFHSPEELDRLYNGLLQARF